ncbi:alpha/beta hydrolase [Shewanella sp. Isolate11]|nr:alpha/beta hydrolase [Shewanella sp. Isolate11]
MRVSSSNNDEVAITLPHICLGGRLWGCDHKPLLLALHGWLDNANSFQPLSAHLSDYQILAIDWPGHGYSQHRPGAYPLHWIDYLYDLQMLIDYINRIKPIHGVIGHSLGGIVASAYSAAFGEKVPHWIFIEAPSPLFELPGKSRERLVRSFADHQRRHQNSEQGNKPVSLEAAIKARHKLTGLDTQWCRLLIERNLQQSEDKFYWRSDPRLKLDSPMRLNFEHIQGLMRDHQARVLLITAENGYRGVPAITKQVLDWYQNLCHIQLVGDHHLHMGNSEQVASAIICFLAEINHDSQ